VYVKCSILLLKVTHLKSVDPFAARFKLMVEQRNKEVNKAIQSGIDITEEPEYNIPPSEKE